MLRKITGRLSYANVLATVAVFLALGGGAYALSLPRNSVGTKQIKKHAVTKPKLGRSAVRSFVPRSGVRRVSFFPTGCDVAPTVAGCLKTINLGNGTSLRASCQNLADPVLTVAMRGKWVSFNISYVYEPNGAATGGAIVYAGTPGVRENALALGDIDAVGTLVIKTAQGGDEITIPFHAYSGGGANCVFEGTATRA